MELLPNKDNGIVTDLLPGSDRSYTYRPDLQTFDEGFVKYTVEMCSGAIIHIPTFHKDRLRNPKFNEGIYTQHGDCIVLIFQNKENRLKMCISCH
jgi:hypothetical protein